MKKDDSKQKQRVKKLLTALNQAPRERFTFEYGCCSSKDDFNRHKKERRGKALLQFTTRKSGKWKKSCSIDKRKPPPSHHILLALIQT